MLAAIAVVLAAAGLADVGVSAPAPPPVRLDAVVTARPLVAGQRIAAADLALVSVPAEAASHRILAPAEAVGRRVAVTLPAGAPLMAAELAPEGPVQAARDVAVRLDPGAGAPAADLAGAAADLYLVPPGRRLPPRLFLRRVLVVAVAPGDAGPVATLRVAPDAVAPLLAAEAAGALRLVARPGGGLGG
jgi:Flp pilus assembly protein CpaB